MATHTTPKYGSVPDGQSHHTATCPSALVFPKRLLLVSFVILVSAFLVRPDAKAQNNVNIEFNESALENNLSNIEFGNNNNFEFSFENNEANGLGVNLENNTSNNLGLNLEDNANLGFSIEDNGGENSLFGGNETALGEDPLDNLGRNADFNLVGEQNLFEPEGGSLLESAAAADQPEQNLNRVEESNAPSLRLTPDSSNVPSEGASEEPKEELFFEPLPGPAGALENEVTAEQSSPLNNRQPAPNGTLPEDAFSNAAEPESSNDAFFVAPEETLGDSLLGAPSPFAPLAPGPFSDTLGDLPGPDALIAPKLLDSDPFALGKARTAGGEAFQEDAIKGPDGLTDAERELVRQRIEELRPIPRGAHPEEYIIQPGDTLWDISDQLLNDPFWWPKLWSFNPSIANPHLIEPGMRLIFEPSDGTLPPSLALSDEGAFLNASVLASTFSAETNPAVDTWKDLPGTFISPSEVADFDLIDFLGGRGLTSTTFVMLPSEILTQPPPQLSSVSNLNSQRLALVRGQILYSDATSGFAPQPGEKFLTARPHSGLNTDTDGIRFGADLWVYTGVIAALKTERTGRTRFTVEDSLSGIQSGDLIIPYREIFVEAYFKRNNSAPTAQAEAVVAAIGDGTKALASNLDIIHLVDLPGSTTPLAALKEGDRVEILSPRIGHLGLDDPVEFQHAGLAEILVLGNGTAAALVTRVDHEIIVGSRTGPAYLD